MSETLEARRTRLMGAGAPLFYDTPLHIVRGEGVWLWDAEGRQYLDAYNNVPHVGHCHPKVVEAIRRQSATLSTHTRYLHDLVLQLIERISATLAPGLTQAVLVNSGSEANDVALRMAQAATGKRGIVAVAGGYHGNTAALAQLSPRHSGTGAASPFVRLVPAPDPLRAGGTDEAGQAAGFARAVALAIADLEDTGIGFAGMILCPFFANEGMPSVGPGFLAPTEAVIRRAGGLLIVDEVQSGFGRLGSHFWGHARMQTAPDVVTMGKSMGNGYPVAACFTRPGVMSAFREGARYFSTFGGNPVAAAAALAVLDVLAEEGLQQNAVETGAYLREGLGDIAHPALAEIRGAGLFTGVEIASGETLAPQPELAHRLVEALRRAGVLTQTAGPGQHVVKFRPPMPFARDHADRLIEAFADALAKSGASR